LASNLLYEFYATEEDISTLYWGKRVAGDVRASAEIIVYTKRLSLLLGDSKGQLHFSIDIASI
jgi:hypothetical protein